jgi:hypothetical protein
MQVENVGEAASRDAAHVTQRILSVDELWAAGHDAAARVVIQT